MSGIPIIIYRSPQATALLKGIATEVCAGTWCMSEKLHYITWLVLPSHGIRLSDMYEALRHQLHTLTPESVV